MFSVDRLYCPLPLQNLCQVVTAVHMYINGLIRQLLLARLMSQCCFARWRLSLSEKLPAGGTAGRRARGRSGGRHCTADQYGYVPLGRHLV